MHRTLHLISLSLAFLMFGCEQELTKDILVPEILSIDILEDNTTSKAYSLFSDNEETPVPRTQLHVIVSYSDETEEEVTDDLNWLASSDSKTSGDLIVVNGMVFVAKNHGDADVTASFRKTFTTKKASIVHIVPLTKVTHIIAVSDADTVDINNSAEHNITVPTGDSILLKADGLFEDNKSITDIKQEIVWRVSDTNIAVVNATGQLTVLSAGILEINASVYSEVNASVTLNITIE